MIKLARSYSVLAHARMIKYDGLGTPTTVKKNVWSGFPVSPGWPLLASSPHSYTTAGDVHRPAQSASRLHKSTTPAASAVALYRG